MISEAEMIAGIKAGREDAYKYIYEHLYKLLCTTARELVHDQVVAEMVVSDVIFSLWQNRQSLTVRTSLRNYMIKAVRNRCMTFLAQDERHISLQQQHEDLIETNYARNEEQQDNPLTMLIEKELDMKIDAVVETLPPQTRHIFCLSRFKKLKYEEIAGQTGTSIDVVKYHIKSALARLKAELKDYILPLLILFLSL
jgi:RNA polymerase sigma-70 factor (ECF subfamily)